MVKRITKRFTAFLLAVVFAVALVPMMPASAATINIGDYVQMGTYYGQPILWRCVNIDENGPLMLSDKIICLKPFDAYTSSNSTTGSHSRRDASGSSNYWADSNMRSWLNSSASAGDVEWLCGNPPSEDCVWQGYNDYADEAGFLTNFTQYELNAIKSVKQKSIAQAVEEEFGIYTTGSESFYWIYDYIYDTLSHNYDEAYGEYVTDTMFLLDNKQANAVYNNRDILGSDYYIGKLTAQCVANSEYSDSRMAEGNKWWYWLRTPNDNGNVYFSEVFFVDSEGNFDYFQYDVSDNMIGVRPAFYLNEAVFVFQSGDGTESNPYIGYGSGGGGNSGTNRNTIYSTKTVTVLANEKDMTESSDKYTARADVKINVGGTEYTTDKNGTVTLPPDGSASVSAEGYYDETVNLSDIKNGGKIYLEKSGMKTPVIRSVTVNGTDIRREKATIPRDYKGNIKAEIDWNGNAENVTYIQNGVSTWQMSNGDTGTINLGSEFNTSGDISIVVKTTNGFTVTKKLKLTVSNVNSVGEDIEVSFGDGFRNIGSGVIPYFDSMSFDFEIPNFPVEISIDGNKVKAVFGVDVAEWAYENDLRDNKQGKWKEHEKQNAFKTITELLKDTKKEMEKNSSDSKKLGKQYKDLKKKLGKAKQKTTAKFGFDAGITAVGYAEGTIDQNGIFFSDGGIIISAEAGVGISGQGMVWIVPYNWEAALKGAIEAQLALAQRELRSQTLQPSGIIKGSVTLKIGAGPGFKNFHANIVGKGSIKPAFTFSQRKTGFTLDATVGAYLELVAWKLSKEFELAEKDFHLYPKAKLMSIEENDFYDLSGFEVIGREYLNEPQEFVANHKAELFSDIPVHSDETLIKTNAYEMSEPVMVSLGGDKRLLVWVDEDLQASVINGTSLMYSVYDGESWSEPQYVERNGFGDYSPKLKNIGGTVYLAWEEASETLADDAGVEALTAALEVKTAVYDEAENKFVSITQLTDNDYPDYMPEISDVEGEAVISYVCNSSGDIFAANDSYSLVYGDVSGSEVNKIDGISSIDSHAVCADGALYIADTDGNIETSEDNELFIYNGSEKLPLTDNETAEYALKEFDGNVYLNNNGILASIEEDSVTDMGIYIPSSNYIVTDSGNMVCVTDGNDAMTEIYAYVLDGEQWSGAVQLTELGANISELSGFKADDGSMYFAFNKKTISGDFGENISELFGKCDLSTVKITPSYNIALDYAYVKQTSIVEGADALMEFDITNNGEMTVNEVNIVITDEDGNEKLNTTENITILPGKSGTAAVKYPIEEEFKAFVGTVKVSVPDADDYDESDNAGKISVDYCDIALDDVSMLQTSEGYIINASISNKSIDAVSDITVNLVAGDEIIDTKTVAELGVFASESIVFENVERDVTYTVEVAELDNEDNIGNNSDTVTIESETVIPTLGAYADSVTVKQLITTGTTVFTVTSDNGGNIEGVNAYAVKYDGLGKLEKVIIGSVADTDEGYILSFNTAAIQGCKIMIWDKNCTPLCEVIEVK